MHGVGAAGALGALAVALGAAEEGGAELGEAAGEVAAALEEAGAGADALEVGALEVGALADEDRVGVESVVVGGELQPARRPTAIMGVSARPTFQVRMGATSPARRGGPAAGDSIARVHRRMLSVVKGASISPGPRALRDGRRSARPAARTHL